MVTLNEAAAELGISPATLRSQIRNGAVQGTKVGPVWTVSRQEIERYRTNRLGRVFGRDAK
jgi:excisionase family DNA binding protein